MLYQLYPQTNQTRIFTEKYSRSKIPYRTAKKMRELCPGGGFAIVGEIGNFSKPTGCQDIFLTNDGKELPIYPRGSLIKPFEWIAGYIRVDKNIYIAAVASIFPYSLRRKRRL